MKKTRQNNNREPGSDEIRTDKAPDVTEDAFLGGALRLRQLKSGHRAGHDAMLLAAATPARPGHRVADLGAGVGAAGLAVARRIGDIDLVLVEIDADLAGLARSQPMMALALLLFMFSLAGVPPLAGFWGKLYVFIAAIEAKLYTAAVLGILSSVVASYYYLRIVKVMYFDEPAEALERLPFSMNRAVAFVSAVVIALFSLAPQPLSLAAAAAAKGLFP